MFGLTSKALLVKDFKHGSVIPYHPKSNVDVNVF